MAWTPMACLPWLVRTRFQSLRNSSDNSRKQIFRKFSYFMMKLYVVCGDSNEYTQNTIRRWKRFPWIIAICFLTCVMINPQWLELPMSRTNFHGPKDVRAIDVRLYLLYTQFHAQMGHTMRKRVFGHILTAKAKISIHIFAVWSGHSLSPSRIIGCYTD